MSVADDPIQQAVTRAVWPWNAPKAPAVDELGRLRLKALLTGLVMVLIAYWLRHRGHDLVSLVLLTLAAFNVALGLLSTKAYAKIDRGLQAFGRLCGQGMTWLLLTPFFFLVFGGARVILTLRGRDPMNRRFPDTPPTYWIPHKPATTPDDYRKQF